VCRSTAFAPLLLVESIAADGVDCIAETRITIENRGAFLVITAAILEWRKLDRRTWYENKLADHIADIWR
jgi:hypothetical protein